MGWDGFHSNAYLCATKGFLGMHAHGITSNNILITAGLWSPTLGLSNTHGICSKPARINGKYVACASCTLWYHTKSMGM